jgi:hypothetical protein
MKEMAPNLTSDIVFNAECENTCVNSARLEIVNKIRIASKDLNPLFFGQTTTLLVKLLVHDLLPQLRETGLLCLKHWIPCIDFTNKIIGPVKGLNTFMFLLILFE